MQEENPMIFGWNGTYIAERLLDHTMQAIGRPNNDTLYVTSNLDLRSEPVVVHYPAFDPKFVCLESYKVPFNFTGDIEKVVIKLKD
jgi:hypothetical protein